MTQQQAEKETEEERIVATLNVGLTEDLDKRLNALCLKQAEETKKIEFGLKTKIMRQALTEWLDKNEKQT